MNVSETSEGYRIELIGRRELSALENDELTDKRKSFPIAVRYNACGVQASVGANTEHVFINVHHPVYHDLIARGRCNVKAKCYVSGKASEQTLDIVVLKEEVPREIPETLEDEDVDEAKED